MKKILILTISVLLIAAACNKQAAVSPTPTPTPAETPQKSVYENSNMKITLEDGWIAKQAGSNQAAVNIIKGNYILYINTQASQASGVQGGRFAEIAQGAPSVDAVVTVQPSPPCGTSQSGKTIIDGDSTHARVDLYVSANDKKAYCAVPTNGQTVWFFSYITNSNQSFFNYYTQDQPPALVVTMSYNSKTINNFPVKGSEELNKMLAEMTGIAQSLEIKKK
ncbi:MAG: hypothetical protein KW788_00890 [Candidatus Doudnabacteria bacterium]|nr:hypothetical protein [Candidatus Doudnabacteria bacterium]